MNRVDTQNHDRKYFLITPQLVLDLCENPLQFTLWSVIRSIAGDTGECYLSTEDLAALSMMSVGSVSTQRVRLVDLGLLDGELRRDAGYTQGVWHLRIPDLWVDNTAWAQRYPSLKDRVLRKKEQRASLQDVKPSGGEAEPSGGEGISREKPSGREANKNKDQNNKRELASSSTKTAQPVVVAKTTQRALASSSFSNNKGKADKRQQLLDYAASKGISADTTQAMIMGVLKIGDDLEIAERFTDAGRRATEEAIEVVENMISVGYTDDSRLADIFQVWKNTHWTAQDGANGGKRDTPRYRHFWDVAKDLAKGKLTWDKKEAQAAKTLKHNGKLVYTINEEGHYRDPDAPSYIYNKDGRFVRIDHDYVPESNTP
jgi:hypothetical protein